MGRKRGSTSSTTSSTNRRYERTTCCRPFEEICSSRPGAPMKPARNSSEPRRSRETVATERSCSSVPPAVTLLADGGAEWLRNGDRRDRRTARRVFVEPDLAAVLARSDDLRTRPLLLARGAHDPKLIHVVCAPELRRTLHMAPRTVYAIDDARIRVADCDVFAIPLHAAGPLDLLVEIDVRERAASLGEFGECKRGAAVRAINEEIAARIVTAEAIVDHSRIRVYLGRALRAGIDGNAAPSRGAVEIRYRKVAGNGVDGTAFGIFARIAQGRYGGAPAVRIFDDLRGAVVDDPNVAGLIRA